MKKKTNDPIRETEDIICGFCGESCKNMFILPPYILRKWYMNEDSHYHWECGIEKFIDSKLFEFNG